MMMKRVMLAASAAAVLMLSACGDTSKIDGMIEEDSSLSPSDQMVNELIEDADAYADAYFADQEQKAKDADKAAEENHEKVQAQLEDNGEPVEGEPDIDLTVLDSNMVYAQVFDMVTYPENYIGQTVKAEGLFAHTVDNDTDYFAVIIADATACCSQGMEFVLAGDHKYPEDYPDPDTEITVTGVFNTYEEDGFRYCTLKNATMVV